MNVVYPICCGVDVHKSFLIGTIISTGKGVEPHYQKKRFSTYNSDLHRFADWLYEHNCFELCMESTGKYWQPVFNILEARHIHVVVANPKWVRAIKGNKDDTKDSKWIGDLFRLGLVPSSFIPSKDIRVLREHTRYRYKLVSMKSSEKNRMQIVHEHLTYIETSIAKVDKVIDSMVAKHESLISSLSTIPSVDRRSAITIISEIGTDMSQFSSSKRLCCWAGLTPGNNESAGKKKPVRITRAGVYLKPALVQVAHAAVKAKDNSYYRLKYEQIAKRRGKKRAIIAIARMILAAIYQMMVTGELWNPSDLFKVDLPQPLKEKQLAKAVKQATRFLENQGVVVVT